MYNIFYQVRDETKEENLKKALGYKNYIYEDARSYRDAMNRNDYNKAVADAEQVGEKSIKAILQKDGKLSSTMKRNHGHDLPYLFKASDIDEEIPLEDLKELKEGYFASRYPEAHKKYTKEEAEKCGKTAFKLMDIMVNELDIPDVELNKEIGGKDKKENIDEFKTWNRLMISDI